MLMPTDKPVVFVRFAPETKKALKKAAAADMRSASSLVEKVMTEWLRQNGFLK
jgi:hypothetical protein